MEALANAYPNPEGTNLKIDFISSLMDLDGLLACFFDKLAMPKVEKCMKTDVNKKLRQEFPKRQKSLKSN